MERAFEDIEFGEELPEVQPDTSLENVKRFTHAAGMTFGRFTDHDAARKEGLPGAIAPGIMSQGLLSAFINRWAPGCEIDTIDTVFRAPVLVDQKAFCRGSVTDVDSEKRRVTVDVTIANEANETRVLGTAVIQFP
jgi:acyl dehydratase